VFGTNKYGILSGPKEWLAPAGLASLAKALRKAESEYSRGLYVSSDPHRQVRQQVPREPSASSVAALARPEANYVPAARRLSHTP
jgi:hypothetical protein